MQNCIQFGAGAAYFADGKNNPHDLHDTATDDVEINQSDMVTAVTAAFEWCEAALMSNNVAAFRRGAA
ncbi:hypothetical protein [Azospirillum endophyticum]